MLVGANNPASQIEHILCHFVHSAARRHQKSFSVSTYIIHVLILTRTAWDNEPAIIWAYHLPLEAPEEQSPAEVQNHRGLRSRICSHHSTPKLTHLLAAPAHSHAPHMANGAEERWLLLSFSTLKGLWRRALNRGEQNTLLWAPMGGFQHHSV